MAWSGVGLVWWMAVTSFNEACQERVTGAWRVEEFVVISKRAGLGSKGGRLFNCLCPKDRCGVAKSPVRSQSKALALMAACARVKANFLSVHAGTSTETEPIQHFPVPGAEHTDTDALELFAKS